MPTLELTARALLDVAQRRLVLDADVPMPDGATFTLSGWPGEARANNGAYTVGTAADSAHVDRRQREGGRTPPGLLRTDDRLPPGHVVRTATRGARTAQLARSYIRLASMPPGAVTADATGVVITVEL